MMLTLILLVATASATRVHFSNRCGHSVDVIRTANGQSAVMQCHLQAGHGCDGDFSSNGMNFKNGWNGLTLAEFSFNSWNGLDFYDLSVIVGYDMAMQITSSTGGPQVTCHHSGCGDAYQYPSDDTKTHGTRTGGTFTVTFCP